MEDVIALAAWRFNDDLTDDAPISVLSVTYCEDAFFG